MCRLDEKVRMGDQIVEGVHEPLGSVEIHATFVVAECERDLGLRFQLRVEFELWWADGQNANLWRVDHSGEFSYAKHAQIWNAKWAALEFMRQQFALSCLIGQQLKFSKKIPKFIYFFINFWLTKKNLL